MYLDNETTREDIHEDNHEKKTIDLSEVVQFGVLAEIE
jgi:hypothetical protein